MVQKSLTIRSKILEALAEGHLSSKEIAARINCHVQAIKKIRSDLIEKGQIEEVGYRLGDKGVGREKIWGLVKAKPKAVNAFDWRSTGSSSGRSWILTCGAGWSPGMWRPCRMGGSRS